MKVLLVGSFAVSGLEFLKRFVKTECQFVAIDGKFDEEKVLSEIEDADVVIGWVFTRRMGERAKKLRLVQNPGAGIDRYQLNHLPQGASVSIVYHHQVAIAEYVIMCMLALTRGLLRYDSQLRRGVWKGSCIFGVLPSVGELSGKTVGIIGFGHIGREVARKAKAFSMRVWAITRNPDGSRASEADFLGGLEDLNRMLPVVDYLIIACPLTEETRGLIGKDELNSMRPTAYLINISRGRIVDERSLYEALKEKRIAGAAIDVWYNYPQDENETRLPSSFPFHELDNVIMSPHISACTRGTIEGRWRDIAENIDRLARGESLKGVVYASG